MAAERMQIKLNSKKRMGKYKEKIGDSAILSATAATRRGNCDTAYSAYGREPRGMPPVSVLDDVDVFVGTLHVEFLAGILLQILVVIETFQHGAVLLDAGTEMVALILQTPYTVLDLYDGNQIAHGKHRRIDEDNGRDAEPYLFAYVTVHIHNRDTEQIYGMCMNLCVCTDMHHLGSALAYSTIRGMIRS